MLPQQSWQPFLQRRHPKVDINLDFLGSFETLQNAEYREEPNTNPSTKNALSVALQIDAQVARNVDSRLRAPLELSGEIHPDLQRRIESVLRCVEEEGSENFDSLVMSYDSKTFTDSSSLDYE